MADPDSVLDAPIEGEVGLYNEADILGDEDQNATRDLDDSIDGSGVLRPRLCSFRKMSSYVQT